MHFPPPLPRSRLHLPLFATPWRRCPLLPMRFPLRHLHLRPPGPRPPLPTCARLLPLWPNPIPPFEQLPLPPRFSPHLLRCPQPPRRCPRPSLLPAAPWRRSPGQKPPIPALRSLLHLRSLSRSPLTSSRLWRSAHPAPQPRRSFLRLPPAQPQRPRRFPHPSGPTRRLPAPLPHPPVLFPPPPLRR